MGTRTALRSISSNRHTEAKRFKIFYDRKPTNATEMENRFCILLNATGQNIRLNESEVYEMMLDLTKALKWKNQRPGYR